MAKFGGFGGGMNMQGMIQQGQEVPEDMLKTTERPARVEETGRSGGGRG